MAFLAIAGNRSKDSRMSSPNWTRREFLGTVAGAAAVVALPTALHAQAAKSGRKPNVLFLMADDMRVELGCYASRFGAKTPNLDALAKSGVRFDRNYCQFPLCNPSRASLLTGRRPSSTGVLGNRTDFRTAHPDWTTLPQLFKNNGYVTVRAGKIYHGGIDDAKSWGATSDKGGPTDDGSGPDLGHKMDVPRAQIPQPNGVLPPLPADNARSAYSDRIVVLDGNGEGHGDYHTADRTIENLRKYKDEPFFIACGFVKPHSPPTAPQKFFDLYDPAKIKLPPDFAAWPTVPEGFPSAAIRKRNADLFIGRGAS
jgi:arylsulfatase A-like enzyme